MHCADPGCLKACPAPGAIVQYSNGIVDFVHENCIGCGYCIKGCPFNIPRISKVDHKAYKCTLCSDRVAVGQGPACAKACPTQAIVFGTKEEMKQHADERIKDLKSRGFDNAGLYDPPGVGGTHVMYVLHHADKPEIYADCRRTRGSVRSSKSGKGSPNMPGWRRSALSPRSASSIISSPGQPGLAARTRKTPSGWRRPVTMSAYDVEPGDKVHPGDPVIVDRYTTGARVNHWITAASLVLLALSGLALFHPSLFFLTALFGGGQMDARHSSMDRRGACSSASPACSCGSGRPISGRREDGTWLARLRDVLTDHEERSARGRQIQCRAEGSFLGDVRS